MIKILKRGFFLAKNFGVMYAMKKGINFLVAKTIKSFLFQDLYKVKTFAIFFLKS